MAWETVKYDKSKFLQWSSPPPPATLKIKSEATMRINKRVLHCIPPNNSLWTEPKAALLL